MAARSKKELWKGRAETALMHLENCIRRNINLLIEIPIRKSRIDIERNRNIDPLKTSEVMLTNMTRPERVTGRRPG